MNAALGVLLASLLGSTHCAGMCGPFVAFYTGSEPDPRRRLAGAHIAYNAGRLLSYLTLGAIAGSIGAGLDRVGMVAGVGRLAAIVAGTLMVAWGTSVLLALRGVRVPLLHAPARLQRAVSTVVGRVRGWPPANRAAVTGLMTALLPCGWLYAFVATAGGTGNAVRAALVMAVFWVGTLPVMLSLGLGLQRLTGPLRARLPAITATVVVVLGLLSIAGRLRPMDHAAVQPGHGAAHAQRG
jgi:sulfite exporter TauE/SafE